MSKKEFFFFFQTSFNRFFFVLFCFNPTFLYAFAAETTSSFADKGKNRGGRGSKKQVFELYMTSEEVSHGLKRGELLQVGDSFS